MKDYIFLISVLILLSGCFKERIDLDNNVAENKKVVINAWITPLDEPQFVDVSYTANYLGAFLPEKISNAIVSLSDQTETYMLSEGEKGKYYLPQNWSPKIDDEYQLKVEIEGKNYTASHVMRPCPNIENVFSDIIESENEEFDFIAYENFISFQEIPGEGDAYYAIDYIKGTLIGDTITNGGFADDAFVDGEYFEDISVTNYDYPFAKGDTAVIEFYSIGLETSKFLQDIDGEIYRDSPFDPPPANVRTNISGGAVGYFIVSDARRVEMIVD